MWLGEPFWTLAGVTKVSIETAEWLNVSKPAPAAFRIQSAEECFATDRDASGEVQKKLRSLLFPQSTHP
jgi:hypothetical protein